MSPGRIKSYLREILHLNETPHRTALAFSVGAFIAFSPFYFFHTAGVILCTWVFRLNFVALMAGALINNPWTLVPILGATFWTGVRLTGMPSTPPINWDDPNFRSLYEQILPYALPFFVGGMVLSCLGALMAYPVAYLVISQYRARLAALAPHERRLPPQTDLR